MASIDVVFRYRFLVLLWSVFEIFMFSAIIFGWASLVVVLKRESFFYHLCQTGDEPDNSTTNSADSDTDFECIVQERRLNLVFTVGVFVFAACGLVAGSFLDKYGPRKTRFLSCLLFSLSYLFFGLSSKDRPNLLFPGMVCLASAGQTQFLTVIQIAGIFEGWKSSVISLFNGAVDSSAIILFLAKLTYEGGVALKWIYMLYFIVAMVAILALAFVLPPTIIQSSSKVVTGGTAIDTEEEDAQNSVLLTTEEVAKPSGKLVVGEMEEGDQKQTTKKTTFRETEDVLIINKQHDTLDGTPNILQLALRPEFILAVMFVAIHTLRLWYYVGSLNSYLEYMSDNDKDIVSKYTNAFGVAQFAGFLFAPFVGFVMDWKPKGKIGKTDLGFVLGFTLTNIISLVLNILVLIPQLKVQYASFVIQVVLRAFVYASFSSFVFHKFPLVHFGKLFGSGMALAACFGCIQYALFTLTENTLKKDQFWVNIGLLILSLIPATLPAFLWWKETRREKNAALPNEEYALNDA